MEIQKLKYRLSSFKIDSEKYLTEENLRIFSFKNKKYIEE